MTSIKHILLLGLASLPELTALNFDDSKLIETLQHKGPWITLGVVADSEAQSAILPKGRELRKDLESAIQDQGGEILPLSVSERMKLERLWSLPYSGRFSKELIQESQNLKAGILTGSYEAHRQNQLQLLVLDPTTSKTRIYHVTLEEDSLSEDQPQASSPQDHLPLKIELDHSTNTTATVSNQKNVRTEAPHVPSKSMSWIFNTEDFKPSRTPPEERPRRRSTNKDFQKSQALRLHQSLMSNPVLTDYFQDLPAHSNQELIEIRDEFILKSQRAFLTASKIELLSRAFIINEHLDQPSKEVKEQCLEAILSHQSFYHDRKSD